jgi:hypothetical protein
VRNFARGHGRCCHRVNQSDGGNGRNQATDHAVKCCLESAGWAKPS